YALCGFDPKESEESVHLTNFPARQTPDQALSTDWEALMELREKILKSLEEAKEVGISFAMDAGIVVTLPAELYAQLSPYSAEMADLCNVSRFAMQSSDALNIQVDDLREEPRCMRSWKRDGTVKPRGPEAHPLTDRDAEVVGLA
ncbi:MAG: hypothetical protein H6727_19865, partial [Myxococcales bacterium]|nr:hypothetical protein [Myxococcales bacterium]